MMPSLTCPTLFCADPECAVLAGFAGRTTRTTVVAVVVCIDADPVTVGADQALAIPQHTLLPPGALDTTLTTVSVVGAGINTHTATIGGLSHRTTQGTCTVVTGLTRTTGGATSSTVIAISLGIDTDPVAIRPT